MSNAIDNSTIKKKNFNKQKNACELIITGYFRAVPDLYVLTGKLIINTY